MEKQFKISKSGDNLIIDFYPEIAPILKIISITIGIVMVAMFIQSFIMLAEIIIKFPEEILSFEFLFSVALLFVYLLAGLYLIRYATRKDKLIIDNEKITFHEKSFLFKKVKEIPFPTIKQIKLTDPPEFTEHPLQSVEIDPTGVVVGEKGVQYLSDPGKIEIITLKESIFVGPKIADWDAEFILVAITEFMEGRNKV